MRDYARGESAGYRAGSGGCAAARKCSQLSSGARAGKRGVEAFGGGKLGSNGDSGDVSADGGDGIPTGAGADEILRDLHAAPGADDDLGIARDNGGRVYDAGFCGLFAPEFREYGIAACDFDEFFDKADTADERVFPFFEKDARAEREAGGGICDGIETGT